MMYLTDNYHMIESRNSVMRWWVWSVDTGLQEVWFEAVVKEAELEVLQAVWEGVVNHWAEPCWKWAEAQNCLVKERNNDHSHLLPYHL
jgi:hypothetical protein